MDRRIREQLPLFDELNATAADDEAFRLLWENGPSDLPGDSVFMASHRVAVLFSSSGLLFEHF